MENNLKIVFPFIIIKHSYNTYFVFAKMNLSIFKDKDL